mgnify:CR=1 FL=1
MKKSINIKELAYSKSYENDFDQIIWEQDSNCVHLGYRHGNNRKQVLIRYKDRNGKLVYKNY